MSALEALFALFNSSDKTSCIKDVTLELTDSSSVFQGIQPQTTKWVVLANVLFIVDHFLCSRNKQEQEYGRTGNTRTNHYWKQKPDKRTFWCN
jgi:hypothetical protein